MRVRGIPGSFSFPVRPSRSKRQIFYGKEELWEHLLMSPRRCFKSVDLLLYL